MVPRPVGWLRLILLLAIELDAGEVEILPGRNVMRKETVAIERTVCTSSMYVGKTVYDRNFPRGAVVHPYNACITPSARAGIRTSDRMVSFVAENCFTQRESDILATASEA